MLAPLKNMGDMQSRNNAFVFMMGVLIVCIGSAATGLFIISAVYVIFLNPMASVKEVMNKTIDLHKQFKILLVLPLFVLCLFLVSITRSEFNELLTTIASHFQLLLIAPMAVGIFLIGQTQNPTDLFIKGLRIGILIILPISIVQFAGFNVRPEGGSGNSLIFAFVLALAGALCLLQKNEDQHSSKLLLFAPPVCAIFMVLISLSRAPMLILIILFSLAAIHLAKKTINIRKLLSVVLSFAVILMVGLSFMMTTDFGKRHLEKRMLAPLENLLNGKVQGNSGRKRLELQLTGFRAFTNKPFLGYGLPNTVEAANSVSRDVLKRKTNHQFSHLHNDYLTYAVAGGVGLLFQFIIILLMPIIIANRMPSKNKSNYIYWFASLVSLGFASIAVTNVVFGHDIMSTFYAMCLLIILLDGMNRSNGISFNEMGENQYTQPTAS